MAVLEDISERKQVEKMLARELEDNKRLHEVSTQLIHEDDADVLLTVILQTSIEVTQADKGNLQMLHAETGALRLRAWSGFEKPFLDRFAKVRSHTHAACGAALRAGARVVVADIEDSNAFDADTRQVMREAGVRAVQSTPLVSRSGRVLGVLSTHWAQPHQIPERQHHLLDVLARQAADLIERHETIRALRESERHLRALSQSLERRVAERTLELDQQAMRLGRLASEVASAEQRERKRIATLLHDDLQQILVAATMRLGRLRSRVTEPSVVAAIEGVADLLNQAAESSRGLTRQLRPPVLYEDGLVPALQWLASEMATRYDLHVHVESADPAPPLTDGVKAMLFECVRELLFNVVKHARVGEASVRVRHDDNHLQITVEDKGRGLDPAVIDKHQDGSGLGLFSIRERLAALGGTMVMESKPGDGLRVRLEAPLVTAPSVMAGDRGNQARAGQDPVQRLDERSSALHDDHRTRVVIADDHALVRQAIAKVLSSDRNVVIVGEASDGVEAVEAVEQHHPDVVLVDVDMPRMNGVEVTREIRRRWPEVRVVALSVHDDEATARTMRDAGAVAVVSKSEDMGRLIVAISH